MCVLSRFKDLDNLWSALSAVLNIGNIQFRAVGNNDAADVASPAVLTKGQSFCRGKPVLTDSLRQLKVAKCFVLLDKAKQLMNR